MDVLNASHEIGPTMTVKLSRPQIETLRELCGRERQHYASSYPPIRKLLGLGLIEAHKGKFTDSYSITEAGRSALAAVAPHYEH